MGRAPDGTPGRTGGTLRLSDPAFYPYENNAAGPGMNRMQSLANYTVTADWLVASNLYLNLGHNSQQTRAVLNLMVGASPVLRGDPNRTLGLSGPANPFAGQLYFDGDWRRDYHLREYRETRRERVCPGRHGGEVDRTRRAAARRELSRAHDQHRGDGGAGDIHLVDDVNGEKQDQEKRWGLRPHKVSFFTVYDFIQGRLKGFTVGGGYRWRSANVIAEDSAGREITGRALSSVDFLLRYQTKLAGLPGRVSFQFNISNLLDNTDPIPVRWMTSDYYQLPGGRGTAYGRLDLEPRDFRLTTTYSY